MQCIDKNELERFLRGNLEPQRILAIDEHVCECETCKSALNSLSILKSTGNDLGAELLSVRDCLEYEELCALIDGTFESEKLKSAQAHINSCELCFRDITNIREMRSHAALRAKISVSPGMTRRAQTKPSSIWKWVSACASAAVIAAVAITLGNLNSTPDQHKVIAKINQPAAVRVDNKPVKTPDPIINEPVTPPAVVATNNKPAPVQSESKPVYASYLKDGQYRVIKVDGKLALAKADGSKVSSKLEAELEASIAQKLKTGKVAKSRQVMVALNTTQLRSGENYVPPSTAPKPVSPVGKIIMTTSPSFNWSKVDLAESYRLRVTDEAGNPIFEGITEKNSLTLDKQLQRGRTYIWQVGVRFSADDQWANSAAMRFAVLSEEGYASIQDAKRQLPGSHLALGVVYESVGLYDEAAQEYKALKKDNPDSTLAHKLLTNAAKH